jgi:hypothetical protein
VDSDSVTRSRQLYSLLQPYAATLQALLERLDHENPFKALAEEDQAPKEFVSLARSASELPAGEIAALLDKVIAANKSGEKDSLELQHMQETLARLEKQIRSLGKDIQSFAKKGVRIPAPLPPDLQEALRVQAARLERDITGARAHDQGARPANFARRQGSCRHYRRHRARCPEAERCRQANRTVGEHPAPA